MGQVLRRDYPVAGAGDPPGSPLKVLARGTAAADIDPAELAQLHPDHFTDDPAAADGPDPLAVRAEQWETPWGAAVAALDRTAPGVTADDLAVHGVELPFPMPEGEVTE